jgi:hypothetical protein
LISKVYSIYPLSYGLGLFVVTSAFIWVCSFLGEKMSVLTKFFIIPFSIFLFFISTFTNFIVYPITGNTLLGYQNNAGKFFVIYSLYFLFLIIFSLYKLLKQFFLEKDILKKKQIQLIFIGGFISGILSFIVNFFIPVFWGTFELIKLVNVVFFPLPIFIIYSMIKHRMFGIKILMTQFFVSVFLSLLLFRFLFSNALNEYYWNGAVIIAFIFFSYLIIKNVNREIELNKKLLDETQKNLEFEQRLKDTYAKIAVHEIKEKYFKE